MDTLNITNTLKSIQSVISSQPGVNVDNFDKIKIVDNRLNIIKRIVEDFEDKNDFFYFLLVKLIGSSLGEIYDREFRQWVGLALDENEELIPQRLDVIYDAKEMIEPADRVFSIKLYDYVCDILENNKDIMVDAETLTYLFDRDPKPVSVTVKWKYYYRAYDFSRLAKIIRDNCTLKKSNISLEDVYQILIQTFQLNNEGVFGNLVTPEEFKNNHELIDMALLDCYANIFVEITNVIKKCFDKDFDRLAIAKLRKYDNFCGKVIIELLRSNSDEEDSEFINKMLTDEDIVLDYNLPYSDTTLKEALACNKNKMYIRNCNN